MAHLFFVCTVSSTWNGRSQPWLHIRFTKGDFKSLEAPDTSETREISVSVERGHPGISTFQASAVMSMGSQGQHYGSQ